MKRQIASCCIFYSKEGRTGLAGLWVLKAIRSPLRSTALTHISGDMEAASCGTGGGGGGQEQKMSVKQA